MSFILLSLLFVSLSWSCQAAKVVFLPMFGRSHFMAMNVVAEELSKRGHEITLAYPDYDANFVKEKPFVQIYPQNKDFESHKKQNVAEMNFIENIRFLVTMQVLVCESFLESDVLKQLNETDVVIGDTLSPCGAVLAAKLGVPYVSMTLGSLCLGLHHPLGVPAPISYVPVFASALPSKMNFFQRVKNAVFSVSSTLLTRWIWFDMFDKMILKYKITDQTTEQLIAETDLLLFQGDFAIEVPQVLPPAFKMIGPLQPKPASSLPQTFEDIMQEGGDDGVVYMAFGTVTQASISEEAENAIARALGRLPMKVIWKKKDRKNLPVGKNTRLMDWLPQNDLLGHPNTRVFITHAGHNGIYEAAYHGVPMVACPLFGDQFDNAVHLEEKGIGITVNVHKAEGLEQRLYDAIMTAATDTRYKDSVEKVSRALKNRARTPKEEAADWIEHVLAVRDMSHFRPQGNQLPFYQLYMLDVMAFFGFILLFIIFVLTLILKTCYKLCFSKKEKIN